MSDGDTARWCIVYCVSCIVTLRLHLWSIWRSAWYVHVCIERTGYLVPVPLLAHDFRAQNGATRRIEIFREDELVLNITKHVLVPTHTPLTSEQKRAVLRRYKITEMQLPRLKVGDPVARYYGLRPGQASTCCQPTRCNPLTSCPRSSASSARRKSVPTIHTGWSCNHQIKGHTLNDVIS